ncbi:MAG: Fe-S cluster assembly protein SufD [Rhodospirillaceae bacterium]|nr:Fe-S cluster assembly protein SufD [Rhodospirillaceae bacterium]
MANNDAKSQPFTALIEEATSRAPENTPSWLAELNMQAAKRYAQVGWPHARAEYWKYTNLNKLAAGAFALGDPAALAAVPRERILPLDGPQLLLVNGAFRSDLSDISDLPDGLSLRNLAETTEQDRAILGALIEETISADGLPFAAVNTAVLTDVLILEFAPGIATERPVHVISLGGGDGAAFAPRLVIRAGDGAVVDVVESHVGTGGYFADVVTQVSVARDARLGHYKMQNETLDAFHIALTTTEVAEGAVYDSFVLSTGARMARNEIRGTITGGKAEYRINGAYMGNGEQHLDNTTFVDHAAAGSRSREIYKGVLAGASRGVFQGKILVRPDAQQSDGFQMNRAMLLSNKAEVDSKPELEIYADDVRCSHGATVGELEEEQLFYLQTRGIERNLARRLLVSAYIDEAIDEVQNPAVKEAFKQMAAYWLSENLTRNIR